MGYQEKKIINLGDDCYLDLTGEVLVKDDLPVALSRIRFRLLFRLAQDLGKPVSSRELIAYAWGDAALISRNDLYVYINRIRQRIEDDPGNPRCLLSLRSMGYVLYPRRKT